jgi:hypothetical protein
MCSKKDYKRAAELVATIMHESGDDTVKTVMQAYVNLFRHNVGFDADRFQLACLDARFPTVDMVAKELREVNDHCESQTVVRLQCMATGRNGFTVRVDNPNNRGYWGSGVIPGYGKRFNSYDLASGLIQEAKESFVCDM